MATGTPSYAFVDIGTSYNNQTANVIGGVYNVLDRRINYENFNTIRRSSLQHWFEL